LADEAQAERRKAYRLGMVLPVRVTGFNDEGAAWEEEGSTADVSQGGLSLYLRQRVELGQVLALILPMPKRLREFDLNEETYRVYGLVRGIIHRDERERVGVMFFGKFPPRGFHERPGARYLLPSDSVAGMSVPPELRPPPTAAHSGAPAAPPPPMPPPLPLPSASGEIHLDPMSPALHDRRASARVNLFVNFTLQLVDEWGTVLQEELTVADNLSRGGAHVLTSLEFAKNDVIQLEESGGGFATRAEVRGVKRGRDGIIRLHLRFLDGQTPDHLLGIKG
jgi:PilZ domain